MLITHSQIHAAGAFTSLPERRWNVCTQVRVSACDRLACTLMVRSNSWRAGWKTTRLYTSLWLQIASAWTRAVKYACSLCIFFNRNWTLCTVSSPSHLDSQVRMWHLSELQLWFQTAAMKLITTTQSTHSQPLWTHALFCCVWLTVGDLPQQRYTETKVPLCCLALTTWFHRR